MVRSCLHISDWHTTDEGVREPLAHIVAPAPDILIVTGDMVMNTINHGHPDLEGDDQAEIWAAMVDQFKTKWPRAVIVAVPGNHDYFDYGIEGEVFSIDYGADTLKVAGVKFTGFRGVPYWKGHWNTEISEDLIGHFCEQLDPTADILLTHTPPRGIMDMTRRGEAVGSEPLLDWVNRYPVKAHCFGHIHEARGLTAKPSIVSNASMGWNHFSIEV